MARLLALIALFLTLASAAPAQDRATLVADTVRVQSGSVLMAEGNVEVYFRGTRLTATAISYDRGADRLTITGPIRIEDGTGNVFLAEAADLSADLTEGLLTSARLVLARQLQMTAGQILRAEGGRITALRSVAASSCTVCAGNPTPLWEIRAREVVHDAEAQQIYFTGASLRFAGVPVLYLPVLRVPDPSLERAAGFLIPRLNSSTTFGTGIKLPYFLPLGPSRDLTFTPFLTNGGDRTLELRFRQAFARGDLEVTGAATRDDMAIGQTRGYIAAEGRFDLGGDYALTFDGTLVSDRDYLADYRISDADRLLNELAVTRLDRDLAFSARLMGLRSLREGEDNDTLPTSMADVSYERRFLPGLLGGVAALRAETHGEGRRAGTRPDGLGRDLARLSVSGDWRRDWLTPHGLTIGALAMGSVDSYRIAEDPDFAGSPTRFSGAAGVELRWPLIRQGAGGVVQTLEPVAQLVLASSADPGIPNGDSTLVEFDEASLFALDRYPGADAVEGGARANLGLSWQRMDPEGWSLGVTAGRVVRSTAGDFSAASGLSGLTSDWLLAWSFTARDGFNLTNRLVLDDRARVTKAEMRFGLDSRLVELSGGYEYLPADVTEGRSATASEIVLQAGRQISRAWRADVAARYDVPSQTLATAGLDLTFRNECIDVALSLSRRYAGTTPSTDLGLSVELLGFGGGSEPGPARTCRR